VLRNSSILTVLFLVTTSLVLGQTSTTTDARALLTELGSMLTKIPETKEECQGLLKQIKTWQEKKINGLETPKVMLRITTPHDKAQVPERPTAEGTVADPNAKVWVIVHPMEVSDYWVQRNVTVKEDGAWKGKIYIGSPGSIDVGKQFEILAVANPKIKLSEGNILNGWPDAEWKSQVIEVSRK